MEQSGILFNVQKFSLNDGPGIRTVVFFKGCPLRCRWCSNPESQNPEIQPVEDETDPAGEKIGGELRTLSSVVEECLQDRDFYAESGGGVTLSGGEPLLQPDFCLALLKALKKEGLHTAMETTGFAKPEVFQKAAEFTDLFLFDVKHWNGEKHREGTGVSNALPLENMKWAIAQRKHVLPRMPVIPGFNNSLEDAARFGEKLKEVGADSVQLLPFHQFGERKYEMLGKPYAYKDVPALHEEELKAFQRVLISKGVRAFF